MSPASSCDPRQDGARHGLGDGWIPNGARELYQRGVASFYGLGDGFHGKQTANGERYDQWRMTAAHRTLPFNTLVDVRDEATGRTVRVRINDRGPFVDERVVDLSTRAAKELGTFQRGIAEVTLWPVFYPDPLLATYNAPACRLRDKPLTRLWHLITRHRRRTSPYGKDPRPVLPPWAGLPGLDPTVPGGPQVT